MRSAPQTTQPAVLTDGEWLTAGRSALQRRIVAPLIVEKEAGAFGLVTVESLGSIPFI